MSVVNMLQIYTAIEILIYNPSIVSKFLICRRSCSLVQAALGSISPLRIVAFQLRLLSYSIPLPLVGRESPSGGIWS